MSKISIPLSSHTFRVVSYNDEEHSFPNNDEIEDDDCSHLIAADPIKQSFIVMFKGQNILFGMVYNEPAVQVEICTLNYHEFRIHKSYYFDILVLER